MMKPYIGRKLKTAACNNEACRDAGIIASSAAGLLLQFRLSGEEGNGVAMAAMLAGDAGGALRRRPVPPGPDEAEK